MKVIISDLMEGNTSYWYKAKEIYEVENYTTISYKVANEEHKGKNIYHGHCKPISERFN